MAALDGSAWNASDGNSGIGDGVGIGIGVGVDHPMQKSTRLVITKMQLENFKSYAGLVEIGPFHKWFSAIVGPNGSGKSNVIDALLFVFGKRASKLRLKKVSELVHHSAAFPHCDTATVSVFFQEIEHTTTPASTATGDGKTQQEPDQDKDDGEQMVPIPGTEFCVTRVATKSNTSKYFVNGNASSFTQVTSLLKAKGIDLDNNRFLILQGEVEQIAMMKPKAPVNAATGQATGEDGLLEYLEDIIGTNAYVEPIDQAWNQVEQYNETRNEKLMRVRVVEKEKTNLETPRNEALEYLRKEKEIYGKTNILYHLYVQDARGNRQVCQEKQTELQEQLALEDNKFQEICGEMQEVETKYNDQRQQAKAAQQQMDQIQAKYSDMEKQDVELREEIKFCKQQLAQLTTKTDKERKHKVSSHKQKQQHEQQAPEIEKQLKVLQQQIKDQEKIIEDMTDKHKEATAQLRNDMEAQQQKLEPFHVQKNALCAEIEPLKTQKQLIEEPFENAAKQFDTNEQVLQDLRSKVEEMDQEEHDATKQVGVIKDQLGELKHDLTRVEQQEVQAGEAFHAARAKAEEATSAVTAHTTRNKMLNALLEASRPGQPLAKAGLLGRLGDLGAIDGKYDVAISTACGALDNLVVETTTGAQECVEFLRKFRLGRATFIILEQMGYLQSKCSARFQPVHSPNGRDTIPRLFDLVRVKDRRFLPAFYFALRDTLVARDLDEATAIAYQGKHCRYRVVTLDGQLVELSGAMSGGGKQVRRGGMSSSLTNTASCSPEEVQQLQQEAESCRRDWEQLRNRKQELEREVERQTVELDRLEKLLPRLRLNRDASKTKMKDLTARQRQLNQQKKLTQKERAQIAEIEAQITSKQEDLTKVSNQVEKMEQRIAELKDQIMDVGGPEAREAKAARDKLVKEMESKTKKLTKIRVDLKNFDKNQAKMESSLEQMEEESQTCKTKLESLHDQLKAMEDDALQILEDLEKAKAEVAAKNKVLKEEEVRFTKLKVQVDNTKKRQVDVKNLLEDCEKMLDENVKKQKFWESKVANLHAAYREEQEQNAGVFDEDPVATRMSQQEQYQASNNGDDDGDVDMEAPHDGNDEGDENTQPKQKPKRTLRKRRGEISTTLPVLDSDELAAYDKEEVKYEIMVLETQRDELKTNVNMGALVEYKRKEQEYAARLQELEDVTKQRDAKRQEYDELRRKRLEEFMTGFRSITLKLKEMYQMITLGGDAELELVDSLDPFAEGVVFSVRPFKKSWKNISNLSGGEKTLASLALVFALHHYKPTPLYVMDEIDAALDFRNVSIVSNYIKQRTRNAQFIIISLRNNMFELADRLVGIYKTSDATKSVTINPKVYQQATASTTPTAASVAATKGKGTKSSKLPQADSSEDEEEVDAEIESEGVQEKRRRVVAPLQDRTNRRKSVR